MAKLAYLECASGISGDMFLAVLIDAGVKPEALLDKLRTLPVGEFDFQVSRVVRSGITATRVDITSPAKQPERHLHHIEKIVAAGDLPETVKQTAMRIFRRLAEVEGAIHGKPPESIHFHEVGAVDAVLDIAGACLGLEVAGITELRCSALNVGSGRVQAAHGSLPVPAPATVELLKGAPVYSSGIEAELVTPTGAAIVATLCSGFGAMPPMKVEQIGYGAGLKDFHGHPNVARILVGESTRVDTTPAHGSSDGAGAEEVISVVEADVDDMSPQLYSYFAEKAFEAGALDVTCGSVQMKKNRPGLRVTILCRPNRANELAAVAFRETTTIGVRIHEVRRRVLDREWATVETAHGAVRIKVASCNGKVLNAAPEFEDCRKLAEEKRVPLKRVMLDALAAYQVKRRL